MRTTLPQRIMQFRKDKKMTQQTLADRVGRSKSWVSHVETGRIRDLSVPTAKAVARVLRVRWTTLYE